MTAIPRGPVAVSVVLLLALAGPAVAAEVPWTRNLAGKFSAGPVYSGALVWDQTATAGLALLVSDGANPSLVLTSLAGTGPGLTGAQAVYGVAVQGKGTRSGNHNGPALTVTSSASMATNQSRTPFTPPSTVWTSPLETYGALSVRSLASGATDGWTGSGGAVNVTVTGGTLSVGVPGTGAGVIKAPPVWQPYASAVYADSVGGAGNQPGEACKQETVTRSFSDPDAGPGPRKDACIIGRDKIGNSGNGGNVTVKVDSGVLLRLDTSGPEPARYQDRTPGVVYPARLDCDDDYLTCGAGFVKVDSVSRSTEFQSVVVLAGVTAVSRGGINSWTGDKSFLYEQYYYGNSGSGGNVRVDFAGSVTGGLDKGVTASLGILAVSVGGEFQCPNHACNRDKEGSNTENYDPANVSQKPGNGGQVDVTLRQGASISVGQGIGILAMSAAGGVQNKPAIVGSTGYSSGGLSYAPQSLDDTSRSGGVVNVIAEAGSSIRVGTAQSVMALGVAAISTGAPESILPYPTPTPLLRYSDWPVGTEVVRTTVTYEDEPVKGDLYAALVTGAFARGGAVTVTNAASIATQGTMGVGIAAMSVGGAAVLKTYGRKWDIGSSPGASTLSQGDVRVDNSGAITTLGDYSTGILAVSSSSGGLQLAGAPPAECEDKEGVTKPGYCATSDQIQSGGSKSDSGKVTVIHSGTLGTGDTSGGGKYAMGIVAQSVGGGGGFRGGRGFLLGAEGVTGGNAKDVSVTFRGGQVSTQGLGATGVIAQSIGGGGGAGGDAAGLFFALGGRAGTGGNAGPVNVLMTSSNPAGTAGVQNRPWSVQTHGTFAAGVVAQSVGGGGGTGGFAFAAGLFASAGVGGKGGSGGSAGPVTFGTSGPGNLGTEGDVSPGVIVQSVGGGGGVGGGALAVSAGKYVSQAVAVGGSGGTGGVGGAAQADLQGQGTLQTRGSDSPGVLVQSVGGGGGIGGNATSLPVAGAGVISVSTAIAIGGQGGSGNSSAGVTVNRGLPGVNGAPGVEGMSISTYGPKSDGILAQSIGGGGGTGGASSANAASFVGSGVVAITASVAVGGVGGSGSPGGMVTVNNHGGNSAVIGISTTGPQSSGVLAQSVGGGGGNGGVGTATGWNLNSAPVTVQAAVGIGGNGGLGNNGNAVKVVSAATGIRTAGGDSFGIVAQSIGGGGGVAGGGGAYGYGALANINVGVGGTGGVGGNGGTVEVNHAGAITTGSRELVLDAATGQTVPIVLGGGAAGIVAQSIGGGGGVGGTADASSALDWLGVGLTAKEVGTKVFERLKKGTGFLLPVTFASNVSVAGKGGAAGDGSTVTVVNAGDISTAGEGAFGIMAQSIGGGGGKGGAVEAHGATTASNVGGWLELALTGVVSVGGGGGAAGQGGAVSVTQRGSLTTQGHGATGVFAQSIGGGGGYGSMNAATTHGLVAIGMSKNGNGGLGGSGGAVSVVGSATSSLLTLGDDAPGILAQSIGGGGGAAKGGCEHSAHGAYSNDGTLQLGSAPSSGGSGLYKSECLGRTQVTAGQGETWWVPAMRLSLAFGGGKGASGNGGAVGLSLEGSIVTLGDRSLGVAVQSIGGGGAYMTASAATLQQTMVSPNAGQNSARGGDITLTQGASGSITTRGAGAWGLLAQSIGSGGGLAGDTSLDLPTSPRSNTLAVVKGDASADGGRIDITQAGRITTSGRNAHGIVAQSIGGGGGISGGTGLRADAPLKMGNSLQMYSSHDQGQLKLAAQAAETDSTPERPSESLTYAAAAYSGMGGAVTIRNSGTVEVTGAGSIGILAQSSGNSSATQQIQVEIQAGGSVKGGTGANAAGIMVLGGNNLNNVLAVGRSDGAYDLRHNTVKVAAGAIVTTVDGVQGRAIVARDGLTDVTNHGTITGSVDLGATPGDFHNYGTFNAGPVVIVAKGTLNNYGTMVVGEAGSTVISGGLRQDPAGKLLVQVPGAATGAGTAAAAPVVSVAGAANIAGTVQVQVSGNQLMPGAKPLFAADQLGFTGQVASAYLFDWQPGVSGQSMTVTPQANFRPKGVSLESSQGSLADYLARAFAAGESSLATSFYQMYQAGGEQDYKALLEGAVGRALHQHSSMALQGLPVLMNQAIDCPLLETQGVRLQEGDCLWVKLTPSAGEQGASRTPFSSNLLSFGGQRRLAQDWWLSGALGTITGKAESSRFSSVGSTQIGSIGLRRTMGAWTLAQLLSVGAGAYDNMRLFALPQPPGTEPLPPVQLNNRSRLKLLALKSRVAYQRPLLDSLYLKPSVDLDLVFTRHPGFSEQPVAQALWLSVHPGSDRIVALSPALEAGLLRAMGDGGVLHLYGSANWRWSPDAQRVLSMSIGSVSAGNGAFEVTDVLPPLTRTLTLGLAIRRLGQYDIALELQRAHNDRADTSRQTLLLKRQF